MRPEEIGFRSFLRPPKPTRKLKPCNFTSVPQQRPRGVSGLCGGVRFRVEVAFWGVRIGLRQEGQVI